MSLVRFRPKAPFADVAHLVERHLAKVEVAGSSPVIRSKKKTSISVSFFYIYIFLFIFIMRRARKGRFAAGEFKQSGELFERPWACRQAGAQPSEPHHPLQNKRTPFWCPFCFTMRRARKGRFAVGEFKQSGELFERPWACELCSFFALIVGCDAHIAPRKSDNIIFRH